MNRPRLGFTLLLCLLVGLANAQTLPQTDLPKAWLVLSVAKTAHVQLAATPEQRQTGLKYRHQMPEHEGMLFIYPEEAEEAERCFWMRDTPLPLTAAFIDANGTIVKLAEMQPLTDELHCSEQPIRFVLEMQQSWFKKNSISVGHQMYGVLPAD